MFDLLGNVKTFCLAVETEIFLEENLDFVPLAIHPQELERYPQEKQEELRQILLSRAKFQIGFAEGRVNRLQQETQDLPQDAQAVLHNKIFVYANESTFTELLTTTPTEPDTSLDALLEFFSFDLIANSF